MGNKHMGLEPLSKEKVVCSKSCSKPRYGTSEWSNLQMRLTKVSICEQPASNAAAVGATRILSLAWMQFGHNYVWAVWGLMMVD